MQLDNFNTFSDGQPDVFSFPFATYSSPFERAQTYRGAALASWPRMNYSLRCCSCKPTYHPLQQITLPCRPSGAQPASVVNSAQLYSV